MKIRDFILSLVSWFILLVTVSCSDELGGERAPISSESNLHVLVPTVLSSRGTRTDDASGLPTYNATVDECQINDLTLYAFPTGNGNEGKLLVETLPAPLATMMVEPHVANYQLNIEPGTYHIYVVANMNKVLSGKTIKTENDLKNIVLYYRPTSTPGMPVCTNIPMIYEPKDDAGNLAETVINAAGDKYTEVAANLKFTCVKVKLNLIFDPTAEGSAFNGNSYIIKDILAQKLSPSTTLSWDGAFSKPASSVSQDYANGFESEVYATSSEASNKGGYYKAGDWTEDATNANVNNKDIITLVQGATPKAAPQNVADKWLFQGTYYLPERYIAEASQQSTLKVNGSVNGNIENYYKIKLGHRQDESSTSKEVPTFPRGTYYEIIGKIKSLGNMTLNCNVSVEDWTPVTIDADFSHTTLWVNKTSAQITSIEEDSISYKSNWVNVEFGCDKIVDGKPLVVVDKRDEVNHIITFRINPEIPMSAYGNGEGQFPPKGKTKIWLKANNLKKYLDVDYNVEPLFEVDPLEVIIYYEASAKTNTKVFTWVTNLGGIVLPNEQTSTIGSSTINISKPSDENAPKGTFQVEATTDPVTTTVHTFRVHSKDSYNSNYKYRDIKVTVRPPVVDYRIYFRAINDRSSNNGQFGTNQFQGILDEYYGTGDNNNNWNDSWSSDNGIQTSKHNVYIYSQKGETTGTAIPKENVWYFNNRYNQPSGMTGDTNNPGWYYKDMDIDAKGYRWDKQPYDENDNVKIKPGETLMIFYSFNNDGADLHRCPHHMAPGITLFNYEDREGWILYDPTTDPYYRIFDEKPIVKDINYVVYTKNKVLGWAFRFGVATNNPTSSGSNSQYTHWDNTWDGHSANSFKSEQVSGGWWKTTIRLKAVDGYHEKGIVLQFEKDDYDEEYTLFGGRSYEKYNDTGYYDNDSWHPGKPSGV